MQAGPEGYMAAVHDGSVQAPGPYTMQLAAEQHAPGTYDPNAQLAYGDAAQVPFTCVCGTPPFCYITTALGLHPTQHMQASKQF